MEAPEVPTEHLHEEMEHQAHAGPRWIMGVALSCALLAALAAVASLQAGHHANEAMMCQIQSANSWSFFQSKSIKESQLKSKMDIFAALEKPVSEADKKRPRNTPLKKKTSSRRPRNKRLNPNTSLRRTSRSRRA